VDLGIGLEEDDGGGGSRESGVRARTEAMSRRERVADLGIALAFVALSGLLIVSVVDGSGDRLVAAALAIFHVAPLAVRRMWPALVLLAMGATALASVPLGVPVVVLGPAALVALYTGAALLERRASRTALALSLVTMAIVVSANDMDMGTVMTNGVALAVAWFMGDRRRRLDDERLAEQAAAAAALRQASTAERLRVARELHDVVAHAMSVIAVQAGTGRFVIDESPEVARSALASIETASRDALAEMRRLLSVLRDEDGHGDDGRLDPAPGLADLDDLVAVAARTGVEVELSVEGEPVDLPAGAELCAYRIVQEALTNVRKHAQARRAAVTVRYLPEAIELSVVDDGIGPAKGTAAGGHGIVGMHERAELYGGSVETGPAADGGYRVRAWLPVGATS
jgi:signal transduction histidine kinase